MPTQDYCPNCNTLLAIPDGVSEVICPNCQILLEFDPSGIDDPSTAPTEPYQEYGDDTFTQPPQRSKQRKKTKAGNKASRGKSQNKKMRTTTTHSSRMIKLNTNTPSERRSKSQTKGAKTESRHIPPPPPKVAPPEAKLNFVSDEDDRRTDSGGIPRDLSNIKIAKPVDVDNVTGLIAPLATAQPVEPEPTQASETKTEVMGSGFVKIVGSSTEFRLDKDGSSRTPPPSQTDDELRRMAEKAQQEAERAKLELEQAKRLAEEERRRLESEKLAIQARQEAENAHRAEDELRRVAEEAQQEAEAYRQQLAQQEAARQQQEEAKRQKEEALAKAKETALARARERLIEEKKKKLIEEAKRRKVAETGALPAATETLETSQSEASKPLRKKKKFSTKSGNKKFRGNRGQ